MTPTRPAHLHQGHKAEHRACEHLIHHGLKLLERNYRTAFGEIDLIMEQHDFIVFVEVRYRRSENYGTPAETVDSRKQAKLRATAQHYLQRHKRASKRPCRFDVVAVTGAGSKERVRWLQDAF
ncbi:MAG: YraN family protein [Nitrospira sp.]|nr:YraN family protein [Nitrospira sp.]MCZ6576130.1 YraN family protein [Gammaproteobacteria bacterium]